MQSTHFTILKTAIQNLKIVALLHKGKKNKITLTLLNSSWEIHSMYGYSVLLEQNLGKLKMSFSALLWKF